LIIQKENDTGSNLAQFESRQNLKMELCFKGNGSKELKFVMEKDT